MSSQEQPLLKLDSVLSAEQMRALLQEATAPQHDKLDFDVLGNVGGPEDGSHSLAAMEDSFHDLENLVLDQGSASGALFAETSEADVEALLKATLGAEDLLSPIDLVFLDHCYCTPLVGQLVSEPAVSATHGQEGPVAEQPILKQETGHEHSSPHDEADCDDAGVVSPGSPQLPLRRSQRQIERIDRERLERIKAENAEQKRREQEEMAGRHTPVLGAESPQAPPPVPTAFSSPLLSPTSAVATPPPPPPPHVASPLQPQPQQQQHHQPQHQPSPAPPPALPTTPKEKASPVATIVQPHSARKGKIRNSESTSSTEDLPEYATPPGASPTRARKKRPREDPEHADVAKPKKGSAPRKSGADGGAGTKGRRDGPALKKGQPRMEEGLTPTKEEHHQPARRKSDDGETKKRKHPPEPVSPFGKVVKVVRTAPEPKKRPRRESFTDEPALFSQPDVLHKEHEPLAAPVPAPSAATPVTAAGPTAPVATTPTTPKPAFPSDESVYDSVEAHVARLAGGLEHSLLPTTAPTPAAAVPAAPVVNAPAAQPAGAVVSQQHKPTTPARHGPAETKAMPKKPTPTKPAAVKPGHPGQPDHKKPALAVAVKSAPPPPSPAKVKHAGQLATPSAKTPKIAKASPKTPQGKTPGSAKKPEPHKQPKKTRPERPTTPVAAAAAPVTTTTTTPVPAVVVAERPKRQSKEKFKRAMMRKREMGRRVDDEDVEDSSEEAHGSDWSSEDDPERLWCICRKPHDDKFMIECDRCKDWFHGTCVGVTRQQGRLLEKENKEWVCPKCSKGENRGTVAATTKKELHRQPSSEDKAHHTKSPHAKAGHPKPTHQPTHQPKPAEEHGTPAAPAVKPAAPAPKAVVRECLVCKRKAECIGLYCGRDCIAKYVHDASQTIKAAKLDGERRLMFTERSSGKLVAGVQTPTPENLTNWLVRNPTFELAVARTPGRPHSTKQPSSKPAQAKQPHTKPAKQPVATPAQLAVPSGANTTLPAPTPGSTTNSTPAESTGSAEAATEVKKPEPAQPSPEPVRLNVRKVLRDALLNRCKEASDLSLSVDEVRRMALRIEEELFKVFRDTGTRYKSKYRSLVFNIKDSRNQGLFRKILRGKIPPDRLVRMTPEELASKELARWREQENKHTIEMIKKEQMEAAQNVSSHALLKKTHKGEVEIDDDNLRLLEKADEKAVAEHPEPPAAVARVPSVGSTTATIETAEKSGRDTTDAHRSHLFDLNCKICTGKVAPPPEDRPTPSPPPSRRSSTASVPAQPSGSLPTLADELSSSSASSTSPPPPPPARGRGGTPPPSAEHSKGLRRPREDSSDLEPSSTVSLGSPDSSKGGSKQPQPSSVWKGFISMQEVSKFVTAAYKVSGPTDFLSQQDIPDTIQVCGRIIPDQVWDYLSKIKQSGNKELLVVRFQPANDEERRPYRELYTYLNSRKRCGVVGNLSRMLKDFYILPLPSHSPVPTVLMPFDGPGLQSGRPHMLLGIIVRHKNRLRPPSGKSRSSWSDRSEAISLTPPLAETSMGAHSDDEEPYEPSYTPPLEKRPRQARLQQTSSASSAAEERTPLADDEDVPYDPEENEVGIGVTTPPSAEPPPPPPPRVSGQAVSELIERISAGANPAAVTTSVLASLASNANLEHQKRLLVELTQEVEEQKRQIELQRLQAIQLSMGKSSSTPPRPPTPSQAQTAEASGIPFLDSSLPTDTGLSFLSGTGTSSGGCSLPSSLQELLNKVKAPAPQQTPSGASSNVSDVLGTLLSSSGSLGTSAATAIGSPQHAQSPLGAKKMLTEDPIVRHFAGDATPESDTEGAGATPPPPGIGDSPLPGTAAVLAAAAGTAAAVSRSPGTPTKDELVVEDASRPQDPRRRKTALQLASASSPAMSPLVTVSSSSGATTSSQLGAKSASELMEMARKQLEEIEVPPPPSAIVQQPVAAPAAPPPPPVYGTPPPTGMPPAGMPPAGMPPTGMPPTGMPPAGMPPAGMPPAGMPPPHPAAGMAPPANLVPPPGGMYGPPPPPPVDPSAYGAPPGMLPPGVVPPGYPPPPPQWNAPADPYWKGPPPPPQAGWNGGGRSGEYRQRGGPPGGWRGGGRRNQWEH